jgi:deoxyribonuclease-4
MKKNIEIRVSEKLFRSASFILVFYLLNYINLNRFLTEMLRVGAHVSIAGGLSKAIERETEIGGNCAQIFVHSPRAWSFPKIDDSEFERFKEARNKVDIKPIVTHSCYLINLATSKEKLFNISVATMKKELEITGKLGVEYYTFHPGSHTGAGKGLGTKRIISGLKKVRETAERYNVKILLENTSGKGDTLGKTMLELKQMIDGAGYGVGICFDTCHGFASGYPIHTQDGLNQVVAEIRDTVGVENLGIIHINDSKGEFNSYVDRHEHIGLGEIGMEAMRRIVNHPDLRNKTFVLETPIDERGDFLKNIEVIKSFRR